MEGQVTGTLTRSGKAGALYKRMIDMFEVTFTGQLDFSKPNNPSKFGVSMSLGGGMWADWEEKEGEIWLTKHGKYKETVKISLNNTTGRAQQVAGRVWTFCNDLGGNTFVCVPAYLIIIN